LDRRTARVYERHAAAWIERRKVSADARRRLDELSRGLRRGARVADLGCGPGWHAALLRKRGFEVIGLDFARAMLREARLRARGVALVRGDLARLPFARGSLDAAWARNSYMHLPAAELPTALAELHRALRPGARLRMSLGNLEWLSPNARERRHGLVSRRGGEPQFRGRLFVGRDARGWRDLFEGAGFGAIRIQPGHEPFWLWVSARRARGLADSLAPRLRLLVCGLNPSPDAAAAGVPFAGATNRFWPAALRAGLVARDRDLRDALARGVGFTDLVKRTTPDSRALTRAEYVRGAERVERLVRLWRPRAVVFVGLEGIRRALDPDVRAGALRGGFAGRPAYAMPSTSGRNASATLTDLVAHLRRAERLTRPRASG
jgi:TDG/mug DNA glycosylase family protein